MNSRKAIVLCLLSFALAAAAQAQVPQMINYQGRITIGGTNFDGTGWFKFALVDGAGATTYWSTGADAVSVPVTKGSYAVLLGDAGMTPIPVAIFTNADVRLRVWFADGTNALQQLSPDQRIAAVGYAMMAANVSDGAITSNKLAASAVTSNALAACAVTTSALATGAVTTLVLATGAVGSVQLAPGAVTSSAIATGAIGSAQLAVLTTNLFMQQGADNSVRWGVGVGNFTDPVSVVHPNALLFSENEVPRLAMTTGGQLYANGDIFANGTVWADGFSSGGLADISDISAVNITALNLDVHGSKNFVQTHPTDPTKEIVYTCLEGPESGTYVRGSAEMVNGKAVIKLPDHFGMVTSAKGLTVQLTSRGTWLELYVTTATVEQVTVGEAQSRSGHFDYLVQGVRLGYENKPVVRERKTAGAKR